MTNLSKLLKAKQAEAKLSTEALAKAIGVSTVSVKGILTGKSKPNAATVAKYSAYLGIESIPGETKKAQKSSSKGGAPKGVPSKPKKEKRLGRKKTVSKAAGKQDSLGAILVDTISSLAGLLDDELAVAVYEAKPEKRALIASILNLKP